ncbi:hypothetical protein [Streptomyces sp. NPDC048438]|uniref:hypothetical protein n=1 Tax=Streptomyces sp. NPDC048438 TaxID=3365551 RepID=UPI003717D62F
MQTLTVDLHMIAKQAAQAVDRLESAKTFVAFLEGVEIEETSRRGLLTLRPPSGDAENIRTEQEETDRGRQLIERARSLVGRWVLVYRYNEEKAGNRQHNVPMLAHLVDLGDGAISVNMAKKVLLDDADGVIARAQAAWEGAAPGHRHGERRAAAEGARPAGGLSFGWITTAGSGCKGHRGWPVIPAQRVRSALRPSR